MQTISNQQNAIELTTHPFDAGQYLTFVRQAAARLGWVPVSASADTIAYYTPTQNFGYGEKVTVTVGPKKATITSAALNEYYNDETQNARNLQQFTTAIDQITAEHHKADRNLHPMHREKYGALVPSKSYLVTPIIVYINALIFIAMIVAGISPLHPTSQSLFEWGGNFRPAVVAGDWWRLGSYMFLHAGAMHLLMNTYALLYIGMFLEPLMGKFRFAATYLLTGVCAALMSMYFHPQSVCIGASGAIFGMYGIFFSILTTSHIQKALRKTMLRSILFFIIFNLMSGMQGNTDNAAHIGGLLSGLLFGYIYYPGIAKQATARRQLITTLFVAAGVVTATAFMLHLLK